MVNYMFKLLNMSGKVIGDAAGRTAAQLSYRSNQLRQALLSQLQITQEDEYENVLQYINEHSEELGLLSLGASTSAIQASEDGDAINCSRVSLSDQPAVGTKKSGTAVRHKSVPPLSRSKTNIVLMERKASSLDRQRSREHLTEDEGIEFEEVFRLKKPNALENMLLEKPAARTNRSAPAGSGRHLELENDLLFANDITTAYSEKKLSSAASRTKGPTLRGSYPPIKETGDRCPYPAPPKPLELKSTVLEKLWKLKRIQNDIRRQNIENELLEVENDPGVWTSKCRSCHRFVGEPAADDFLFLDRELDRFVEDLLNGSAETRSVSSTDLRELEREHCREMKDILEASRSVPKIETDDQNSKPLHFKSSVFQKMGSGSYGSDELNSKLCDVDWLKSKEFRYSDDYGLGEYHRQDLKHILSSYEFESIRKTESKTKKVSLSGSIRNLTCDSHTQIDVNRNGKSKSPRAWLLVSKKWPKVEEKHEMKKAKSSSSLNLNENFEIFGINRAIKNALNNVFGLVVNEKPEKASKKTNEEEVEAKRWSKEGAFWPEEKHKDLELGGSNLFANAVDDFKVFEEMYRNTMAMLAEPSVQLPTSKKSSTIWPKLETEHPDTEYSEISTMWPNMNATTNKQSSKQVKTIIPEQGREKNVSLSETDVTLTRNYQGSVEVKRLNNQKHLDQKPPSQGVSWTAFKKQNTTFLEPKPDTKNKEEELQIRVDNSKPISTCKRPNENKTNYKEIMQKIANSKIEINPKPINIQQTENKTSFKTEKIEKKLVASKPISTNYKTIMQEVTNSKFLSIPKMVSPKADSDLSDSKTVSQECRMSTSKTDSELLKDKKIPNLDHRSKSTSSKANLPPKATKMKKSKSQTKQSSSPSDVWKEKPYFSSKSDSKLTPQMKAKANKFPSRNNHVKTKELPKDRKEPKVPLAYKSSSPKLGLKSKTNLKEVAMDYNLSSKSASKLLKTKAKPSSSKNLLKKPSQDHKLPYGKFSPKSKTDVNLLKLDASKSSNLRNDLGSKSKPSVSKLKSKTDTNLIRETVKYDPLKLPRKTAFAKDEFKSKTDPNLLREKANSELSKTSIKTQKESYQNSLKLYPEKLAKKSTFVKDDFKSKTDTNLLRERANSELSKTSIKTQKESYQNSLKLDPEKLAKKSTFVKDDFKSKTDANLLQERADSMISKTKTFKSLIDSYQNSTKSDHSKIQKKSDIAKGEFKSKTDTKLTKSDSSEKAGFKSSTDPNLLESKLPRPKSSNSLKGSNQNLAKSYPLKPYKKSSNDFRAMKSSKHSSLNVEQQSSLNVKKELQAKSKSLDPKKSQTLSTKDSMLLENPDFIGRVTLRFNKDKGAKQQSGDFIGRITLSFAKDVNDSTGNGKDFLKSSDDYKQDLRVSAVASNTFTEKQQVETNKPFVKSKSQSELKSPVKNELPVDAKSVSNDLNAQKKASLSKAQSQSKLSEEKDSENNILEEIKKSLGRDLKLAKGTTNLTVSKKASDVPVNSKPSKKNAEVRPTNFKSATKDVSKNRFMPQSNIKAKVEKPRLTPFYSQRDVRSEGTPEPIKKVKPFSYRRDVRSEGKPESEPAKSKINADSKMKTVQSQSFRKGFSRRDSEATPEPVKKVKPSPFSFQRIVRSEGTSKPVKQAKPSSPLPSQKDVHSEGRPQSQPTKPKLDADSKEKTIKPQSFRKDSEGTQKTTPEDQYILWSHRIAVEDNLKHKELNSKSEDTITKDNETFASNLSPKSKSSLTSKHSKVEAVVKTTLQMPEKETNSRFKSDLTSKTKDAMGKTKNEEIKEISQMSQEDKYVLWSYRKDDTDQIETNAEDEYVLFTYRKEREQREARSANESHLYQSQGKDVPQMTEGEKYALWCLHKGDDNSKKGDNVKATKASKQDKSDFPDNEVRTDPKIDYTTGDTNKFTPRLVRDGHNAQFWQRSKSDVTDQTKIEFKEKNADIKARSKSKDSAPASGFPEDGNTSRLVSDYTSKTKSNLTSKPLNREQAKVEPNQESEKAKLKAKSLSKDQKTEAVKSQRPQSFTPDNKNIGKQGSRTLQSPSNKQNEDVRPLNTDQKHTGFQSEKVTELKPSAIQEEKPADKRATRADHIELLSKPKTIPNAEDRKPSLEAPRKRNENIIISQKKSKMTADTVKTQISIENERLKHENLLKKLSEEKPKSTKSKSNNKSNIDTSETVKRKVVEFSSYPDYFIRTWPTENGKDHFVKTDKPKGKPNKGGGGSKSKITKKTESRPGSSSKPKMKADHNRNSNPYYLSNNEVIQTSLSTLRNQYLVSSIFESLSRSQTRYSVSKSLSRPLSKPPSALLVLEETRSLSMLRETGHSSTAKPFLKPLKSLKPSKTYQKIPERRSSDSLKKSLKPVSFRGQFGEMELQMLAARNVKKLINQMKPTTKTVSKTAQSKIKKSGLKNMKKLIVENLDAKPEASVEAIKLVKEIPKPLMICNVQLRAVKTSIDSPLPLYCNLENSAKCSEICKKELHKGVKKPEEVSKPLMICNIRMGANATHLKACLENTSTEKSIKTLPVKKFQRPKTTKTVRLTSSDVDTAVSSTDKQEKTKKAIKVLFKSAKISKEAKGGTQPEKEKNALAGDVSVDVPMKLSQTMLIEYNTAQLINFIFSKATRMYTDNCFGAKAPPIVAAKSLQLQGHKELATYSSSRTALMTTKSNDCLTSGKTKSSRIDQRLIKTTTRLERADKQQNNTSKAETTPESSSQPTKVQAKISLPILKTSKATKDLAVVPKEPVETKPPQSEGFASKFEDVLGKLFQAVGLTSRRPKVDDKQIKTPETKISEPEPLDNFTRATEASKKVEQATTVYEPKKAEQPQPQQPVIVAKKPDKITEMVQKVTEKVKTPPESIAKSAQPSSKGIVSKSTFMNYDKLVKSKRKDELTTYKQQLANDLLELQQLTTNVERQEDMTDSHKQRIKNVIKNSVLTKDLQDELLRVVFQSPAELHPKNKRTTNEMKTTTRAHSYEKTDGTTPGFSSASASAHKAQGSGSKQNSEDFVSNELPLNVPDETKRDFTALFYGKPHVGQTASKQTTRTIKRLVPKVFSSKLYDKIKANKTSLPELKKYVHRDGEVIPAIKKVHVPLEEIEKMASAPPNSVQQQRRVDPAEMFYWRKKQQILAKKAEKMKPPPVKLPYKPIPATARSPTETHGEPQLPSSSVPKKLKVKRFKPVTVMHHDDRAFSVAVKQIAMQAAKHNKEYEMKMQKIKEREREAANIEQQTEEVVEVVDKGPKKPVRYQFVTENIFDNNTGRKMSVTYMVPCEDD